MNRAIYTSLSFLVILNRHGEKKIEKKILEQAVLKFRTLFFRLSSATKKIFFQIFFSVSESLWSVLEFWSLNFSVSLGNMYEKCKCTEKFFERQAMSYTLK